MPIEVNLSRAKVAAARVLMSALTFRHDIGGFWVVNQSLAPAWVADPIAQEILAPVLAVHTESDGRCTACLEPCHCLELDDMALIGDCPHGNAEWPCPTIRALEEM